MISNEMEILGCLNNFLIVFEARFISPRLSLLMKNAFTSVKLLAYDYEKFRDEKMHTMQITCKDI